MRKYNSKKELMKAYCDHLKYEWNDPEMNGCEGILAADDLHYNPIMGFYYDNFGFYPVTEKQKARAKNEVLR
jgi:hypothetical protein